MTRAKSASIPLRSCSSTWILSAFADEAADSSEGQIAALKRCGFKHIDLRGVDGHNISALPLDVAKSVRAKLDAAGIKVNMFGSPIGKIDIADDMKVDLDKLRHMAQLAPVLGCNAIRIFSYYNKHNRPKSEWQAETLKRLGALRDLARELGVVLYHENERHIFGDNCADVLTILRALRDHSPEKPGAFRAIFDFDNYNQGGEDAWQNWLALRDLTDAFHLKESDKNNLHVPIGTGNGRVREILSDAKSRGWCGPLILEPHLQHSKAVLATVAITGMTTKPNAKFAEMKREDVFHYAAETAKSLMGELKAAIE